MLLGMVQGGPKAHAVDLEGRKGNTRGNIRRCRFPWSGFLRNGKSHSDSTCSIVCALQGEGPLYLHGSPLTVPSLAPAITEGTSHSHGGQGPLIRPPCNLFDHPVDRAMPACSTMKIPAAQVGAIRPRFIRWSFTARGEW